jgi:hypothetical protein
MEERRKEKTTKAVGGRKRIQNRYSMKTNIPKSIWAVASAKF